MDREALSETTDSELRSHLAVLRSRRWSVIVLVVVATAIALTLSFRQTPLYRGESRVLVKSSSPDAYYVAPPDLPTEAQLVKSEPVARLVKDELRSDKPTAYFLNNLSVDPVPESAVMRLIFVSGDATEAQQAANAFGSNYIQYRRQQTQAVLEQSQASLQSQIDKLERQLAQVAADQAAAVNENNAELAAALEAERGTLIARLGVLEQRLSDLEPQDTADLGGGEVIEAATLPTSPFSPNHISNGVLGALVGLFLGVGVAFARERLDERIRNREDAEEWLRSPVIAVIPRHAGANPKKQEWTLVARSEPHSHVTEHYRTLRTNMQFVMGGTGMKSVLLSSPSAREGKTTTTANLAVTLAEAGKRIVLVSADMRRPMIENYFGVKSDHGLSTWLASEEDEPWAIIQDPGVRNLRVIPTGHIPPNPAELLSSPRMGRLLQALEAHSDLVLLDTPPVLAVADAPILASFAGGSILVVESGSTERSAAQRAKAELERAGRPLLGLIVNSVAERTSDYYYTGSYYSTPQTETRGAGKPAPERGGLRGLLSSISPRRR
ncbi:MAG: polysaccharide biosynthesis tyrosine autokinase [Actinomycetota bacterium]